MSDLIASDERMKPVVILKTGTMSKADIKLMRDNGLLVVESKEPGAVRYLEPAPQGYSVQQWAALELARALLTDGKIPGHGYNVKQTIGAMYAEILMRGDPLKHIEPVEKL